MLVQEAVGPPGVVEQLNVSDTYSYSESSSGIFYKYNDGTPVVGYRLESEGPGLIVDRDGILSLLALWHTARRRDG